MIDVKTEDNITIVTLNNGPFNMITEEAISELHTTIKNMSSDDSVKGMIITGSGKVFSGGFDLNMFVSFKTGDDVYSFFKKEEEFLHTLFTCPKPVISALNGHTIAMGLILAMASDYRISVNHPAIKIGMSEIKLGLHLAPVQSEIMKYGLETSRKFRDVMYFADMINPEKALKKGMIDELVDLENLISRAKEIIKVWTETPGKPFSKLKMIEREVPAGIIESKLSSNNWKHDFDFFFDKEIQATLQFVIDSMAK